MRQFFKDNRIPVLFLAYLLLFPGICFSVGKTNARYFQEVGGLLVHNGESPAPEWDFLIRSLDTEGAGATEETQVRITNTLSLLRYPSDDMVAILQIKYPEGCNQAVFCGFPQGTRYSYDGQNGYRLNEDGNIQVTGDILFLQIPREDTFRVCYYKDTEIYGYDEVIIEKMVQDSWNVVLQERDPVLMEETSLHWNILGGKSSLEYRVTIQYLTENGYEEIPVGDALTSTWSEEEDVQTLTITNSGTNFASAGTYRMKITQMDTVAEGLEIQLQTVEVPFFVNYR